MPEVRKTLIKELGWKRDLPDPRDKAFVPFKALKKVRTIMLFNEFHTPPIVDQLRLGSCTANGQQALVQFNLMNGFKLAPPNPGAPLFVPSRLFTYYFARLIDGTQNIDAGTSNRNVIKVVATMGVPDEKDWPYDVDKFDERPSDEVIEKAAKFKAVQYYRINNGDKALIVSALEEGRPILFGFLVFDSFMSDEVEKTGIVPYPDFGHERPVGGHACVIWGYNAERDVFICRNSWGKGWGKSGYFEIPASYLTNYDLAADFWVINTIDARDPGQKRRGGK